MKLLKTFTTIIFIIFSFESFAEGDKVKCVVNDAVRKEILKQISAGDVGILAKLDDCYALDRQLILQATLIDYNQFKNTNYLLKKDDGFVYRIVKLSPQALQFASPELLNNQNFIKQATYIYRDALKYADPKLLDNKFFMAKMINIDSRNYLFASERIKSDHELAKIAFSDNGILLASAPKEIKSDKALVKIAILSNIAAFDAASPDLKADKELKKLAANKPPALAEEEIKKFLEENYLVRENKKNLGLNIANRAQFSKANAIIDRNYVTKWQGDFLVQDAQKYEALHLTSADSHNYPNLWRDDFKKYPSLVKKIEEFFLKHNLDQNTINNLSTTYFWKIKDKPLTLLFNLYLMRDSMVADLGNKFSNVTSLTAIVQENKGNWKLTVVEVIFDSEIKVDVSYNNGHKRYIFWDLYRNSLSPKIIFKVEDKFKDFFEIFEEESGGKYQMISRIELDLQKNKKR